MEGRMDMGSIQQSIKWINNPWISWSQETGARGFAGIGLLLSGNDVPWWTRSRCVASLHNQCGPAENWPLALIVRLPVRFGSVQCHGSDNAVLLLSVVESNTIWYLERGRPGTLLLALSWVNPKCKETPETLVKITRKLIIAGITKTQRKFLLFRLSSARLHAKG